MIRKVALLLLVLTGIIPTACICPENPSGPYLLHLTEVMPVSEDYTARPLMADKTYIIAPNDTYTEDTLLQGLNFAYEYAQHNTSFKLHASALALSCPDHPSYEQLNDKITDITIISNVAFDDIPAGEPLNSKVVAFNEDFNSALSLGQATERINSITGNEFMNSELSLLAITEKPAVAQERTFTITVAYKSGKADVMVTHPITW